MLNQSQIKAEAEIKQFLLSGEKAMALIAPAGYGKSFLIDHIIQNTGHYNKRNKLMGAGEIKNHHKTATTNKAASVLDGGQTIQSLLGLTLRTDYDTGKQALATSSKTKMLYKSLVFIDESSMVSRDLTQHFKWISDDSKIIFVGDDCQLAPVNEDNSIAFNSGFRTAVLDEPMRQDPNSDLFKLCTQLRETVKTGIWQPIENGTGITHMNSSQIATTLDDWFYDGMDPNEARCITYRNEKAIKLNSYIRPLCGHTTTWAKGDIIAARNSCKDFYENERTSVEEIMTIHNIDTTVSTTRTGVDYVVVTFTNGMDFRVATNPAQLKRVMDTCRKNNQWRDFYDLKEGMLDMRSAYACTGHVSQGSTYDKVYVDLADMGTCWDPKTLARLLYVAVSRAKNEVVFNGQLPAKFRG